MIGIPAGKALIQIDKVRQGIDRRRVNAVGFEFGPCLDDVFAGGAKIVHEVEGGLFDAVFSDHAGIHPVFGHIDVGFASVHRVKEWDKGLRFAAIVADSDFNRIGAKVASALRREDLGYPDVVGPKGFKGERPDDLAGISFSGTTDGEVKLVRGIFFEPGHLQLVGGHLE